MSSFPGFLADEPTTIGRQIVTAADAAAVRSACSVYSTAQVDALAANYATAAQGTLADSALQPSDITSGTITAGTGDVDFDNLGGGSLSNIADSADGVLVTGGIEARDGLNPEHIYVYNTYTSGTDYERGGMWWDGNTLKLGTEADGTGVVRKVELSSINTANFAVSTYLDSNRAISVRTPNNQEVFYVAHSGKSWAKELTGGSSITAENVDSGDGFFGESFSNTIFSVTRGNASNVNAVNIRSHNASGDVSFQPGSNATETTSILASSGDMEIHKGDLIVETGDFKLLSPTVPSSASDTGEVGQMAWDSGYIYVCVATNTWKRSPLSTW